ncbi:MAG: S8 family serine peptidase [Betaproteobacteria bacterium]|nr:S8 family serine peptidase [Betaproteobacteria bacterium]
MPARTRRTQQPTFRVKHRLTHIPGQLIVRFKEKAIPRVGPRMFHSAARMTTAVHEMPETVSGPLDYLRNRAGLETVTPLFSGAVDPKIKFAGIKGGAHKAALVMSVAASPSEELRGFNMVEVDPKAVTAKLVKDIEASDAVDFVEPMPARWIVAAAGDPMQGSQWGLHAIGWFDQALPSAHNITVAVLDTGIDATHPDLKELTIDYDHGGFRAEDVLGHGTHVAGIIAAILNNAVGISGVANCKLKVWKIFPDKPTDGDFYVDGERYLQSLRAVEDSGARVLNLSIGGASSSQTEQLLFRRLVSRGINVVAAMGNEFNDGNPVEYPGAYSGVIAVGAVDSLLDRADFSNTGKHIHVVAPGVSILSTLPMKKSAHRDEVEYAAWDGTSMATPHVAGGVARLLGKSPQLTAAKVRSLLRARAKRLLGMKGKSRTSEYGYGLLYLPNLLK